MTVVVNLSLQSDWNNLWRKIWQVKLLSIPLKIKNSSVVFADRMFVSFGSTEPNPKPINKLTNHIADIT